MATIPTPGSELRHVRKTITFDGTAGNGAIGTVTVFTLTGRVLLKNLGVFVSTTLAGATAALQLGTPNHTNMFVNIPSPNVPNETGGSYMNPNLGSGFDSNSDLVQYGNQSSGSALTAGDIIWTIAGGAVTGGVVVVDAWYTPVTDDGALAGDDIDSQLVDAIWDEPQSGHTTAGTFGRYLDFQLATIAGYIDTEIAAIKAVTDNLPNSGALSTIQSDLDDIQTRLPAALVGGRMDSSVGAMAAAVITAAAIATDAIDADALAADAVTEIWAKAMSELASVPAVNGTVLQALEWIFLLARNKLTQTATTQTLRNDADNANLSTSTVSDDGTTFTRGEWS